MHVLVALLEQQQDEEEDEEEGFVLPVGSFLALGRNLRRKDSLMGAEVSDEVGGRATTSQPTSRYNSMMMMQGGTRLTAVGWCQILDELLRSDEDEDPITAHMFANSSEDDIRRYEADRETVA